MLDTEEVEFMREGVNLLVETENDSMQITHMNLTPEQSVHLVQFLVEKLEGLSGIHHDEILEDLKYGEIVTPKNNKKSKKKKKERK